MNELLEHIMDFNNKTISYAEKYQFIEECLSNEHDKKLLIQFMNESSQYYLYDYLHHSHKGEDLMPVDALLTLLKSGVHIKTSVEMMFFASSIQEHYNPISIYLLENFTHYQDDLNLFCHFSNNVILFEHLFFVKNMPLLDYFIQHYEYEDKKDKMSQCLLNNQNSQYNNILAYLLYQKPKYFIEKMNLLEQFKVDLNQYFLIDFVAHNDKREKFTSYPHFFTPLSLAKEVKNQEGIDYLMNHPNYHLGEYKESFVSVGSNEYQYFEGNYMKKIKEQFMILNEKAKLESVFTVAEADNKVFIFNNSEHWGKFCHNKRIAKL